MTAAPQVRSAGVTPRRVFLPQAARERFASIARAAVAAATPAIGVRLGYSIKTNPRRELLQLARASGLLAETISRQERAWALQCGFDPADTIANGPVPPSAGEPACGFVFADSLESFAGNARRGSGRVNGARLRPSMIESRFGIALEDDVALAAIARRGSGPLAVSFHVRREDFRGASWRDVASDVVERAVALQARAGRPVVAFDVGGGWTTNEFDDLFVTDTRWLAGRLERALPACREILAEPGQAACTPAEALVTSVVEVRERRGRREAILDLGYSDWPDMHAYVHDVFAWDGDAWIRLGVGPDRMAGRTCLEYDVITGLKFPPNLGRGDRLLIGNAGSYDGSMAFQFGLGGAPAVEAASA